MRPVLRVAAAAALLGAAAGCHGRAAGAPVDAFVHFVAAVGAGRRAAAWGLLATTTREQAAELGARQSPPVSGEALLLGGQIAIARHLAGVSLVSRHGDRAVLRVTAADGTRQTVTMHREDGAWKVVLPL